ncbi:hypothetical protein [Xenorhabdus siamensis]|uniref:hypothetical protein n=1 Tax=Xenorhabdus siamensis TaxID=3136254 RepID=UPI0030F43FB2
MTVLDSLLAFTVAATLLTLTPGLDTALILRTAAAKGGKKAFQAALGIDTGCLIWGAMVAFGLVAIHVILGTLWSLALIYATRPFSHILRRGNVIKWMNRTTGGLFLFFAFNLALSRR